MLLKRRSRAKRQLRCSTTCVGAFIAASQHSAAVILLFATYVAIWVAAGEDGGFSLSMSAKGLM
jgi:hypothetical protein